MISLIMIVSGLWLLTWSANRFVDGAAALSQKFGVPPFIIGMVVIGFGTSAPEMAVSALSASIALFGCGFSRRKEGVIGRLKGFVWVMMFFVYFALLLIQEHS